jgi:hypothetical protein
VAAGWALDLFRGMQTREHADIEIAVPAAAFPKIRDRFPGYAFDAVGSGRIWENAAPDVLAATHQTWPRDPATGYDRGDRGPPWPDRPARRRRLPRSRGTRRTPASTTSAT